MGVSLDELILFIYKWVITVIFTYYENIIATNARYVAVDMFNLISKTKLKVIGFESQVD